MKKTILFIDGENFLHKVKDVLIQENIKELDLSTIDYNQLFKYPLKSFKISRKIFYAAKLHFYAETKKKSEELIKFQRKLRNTLVNQGYEFVVSGHVRGQKVGNKTIFREKGVDVKIAVDLVSLACDKRLDTAIICSSDSDMQPAIEEVRRRDIEVVYLGFESIPNKGLIAKTNRTILFRNAELIESLSKK